MLERYRAASRTRGDAVSSSTACPEGGRYSSLRDVFVVHDLGP